MSKALDQQLIAAVLLGHIATTLSLLNKGANLTVRDREHGQTLLMLASERGHIDIMQYLIGVDVDVNAKDELGRTALMYAAMNGQKNAIRLLTSNGADVNLENSDGETALSYGVSSGDAEIVQALLENVAFHAINRNVIQYGISKAKEFGFLQIGEILGQYLDGRVF